MAINLEAVNELASALETLLPPAANPALRPNVLVNPLRITPAGLGGFVGLNQEPPGEIHGVHLEATAFVTVKADRDASMNAATAAITHAVVAAERASLLRSGIVRIALEEVGPISVRQGGGVSAAQQRDLTFSILFEYLKRPEVAEGIIREIPLDVDVEVTGALPRSLISATFMEGSLDLFEVVDDPAATTSRPSLWQLNPAERRIEQRSNIRGGSLIANANKPGTYLVLRSGVGRPPVRDFVATATVQSNGSGGLGMVFRWQDVENFYFFLMDQQGSFRILGRKVGGTFDMLAAPALDETQSYESGRPYLVRISAQGSRFRVFLDGQPALAGEDDSLAAPGRVGLMCRQNNLVDFYSIALLQL